MKPIFLVIFFALAASSCAQLDTLSMTCGGTSGYQATKITYGDSQIKVKPKSFGKNNKELQFRLDPKSDNTDERDYKTVKVTVKGKASDPNSSWINGSSTFNSANVFFAGCVPANAPEDTVYKYIVTVEHVGELDPRVQVKN
ncbi:MAG: hypothetical protein HKN77_04995 [Woeseiaceae bacterium]|nr:hypothetical protein [Woeseiaceae bacterium]